MREKVVTGRIGRFLESVFWGVFVQQMPVRSLILFLAVLPLSSVVAQAEQKSVQWTIDPACPPVVMGREYWTLLNSGVFSDPHYPLKGLNAGTGLEDLAFFRDAALVYPVGGPPPPDGRTPAWRHFADNYPGGTNNPTYIAFEARAKPSVPVFTRFSCKRGYEAQTLLGEVEVDDGEFETWRARHPNLAAFVVGDEWDNEICLLRWNYRKFGTKEQQEEIRKRFYDFPLTKAGCLDRAKVHFDRRLALYYGRKDLCAALRGWYATDHMAAAFGAMHLGLETTNTSGDGEGEYEEWRWDVSGMFIRGAARQFGLPWCWFVAIYMNGYTADGRVAHNSVCWYPPRPQLRALTCPEGGVSASLFNRVCHYAYLNGATYVEPEGWAEHLLTTNAAGKRCLSPRGELFRDYHEFTRRCPDRGSTYAPVAILTPFNQGYPTCGGWSWRTPACGYSEGDQMVDGVFFTLVPGFDRPRAMKAGEEHNLHNTPYAMMYDVLAPDSPQDPKAFAAVLAKYPVAILAGEYPDLGKITGLLADYVRNGGTLLLPRANLMGEAASRRFETEAAPSRRLEEDGVLRGTEYAIGRGRLIVSASPWMTPPLPANPNAAVLEIQKGERTFPEIAYFLKRFQSEYFPFEVSGRCQYGANFIFHKRRDAASPARWWLWMLNNDGVTKFADQFERVDPSAASVVTVKGDDIRAGAVRELIRGTDVPAKDGGFTFSVPAGGVAVFEICR